ncbi:hypothetical protein BH10CHL1_BH10CHL1_26980 [soil metagenome]
MASPIGHALLGIGLATTVAKLTSTPTTPALWIGAAIVSCLPDLDMIGLGLGLSLTKVHRQATHSLFTLSITILVAMTLGRLISVAVPLGYSLAWGVALLSHPLLDVVTTSPSVARAGFGIPLFWPISSRRWFVQHPWFESAPLKAYRSVNTLYKALLPELRLLCPITLVLIVLSHLL